MQQESKLGYSIDEFVRLGGPGRTKVFAEIARGALKTYTVGRRRYISAEAAAAWQRLLEDEEIARRQALAAAPTEHANTAPQPAKPKAKKTPKPAPAPSVPTRRYKDGQPVGKTRKASASTVAA